MGRLHRVAKKGDPFRLQALLEGGADPNEPSSGDGLTPLMAAASGDRLVNAKVLLAFGSDANARSARGSTALDCARTTAMRRLLLESGADPNTTNVSGLTHAAFFAMFGNRELVDLFLEFGADPEAKGKSGRTVREMMALTSEIETETREFMAPGRPGNDAAILKFSENLQLSPEEYVSRNREILIWSLHRHTYTDPRLQVWAQRVFDLFWDFDALAASYEKYLKGDELQKALRSLRKNKARAHREAELKRLDAEYEATYGVG